MFFFIFAFGDPFPFPYKATCEFDVCVEKSLRKNLEGEMSFEAETQAYGRCTKDNLCAAPKRRKELVRCGRILKYSLQVCITRVDDAVGLM